MISLTKQQDDSASQLQTLQAKLARYADLTQVRVLIVLLCASGLLFKCHYCRVLSAFGALMKPALSHVCSSKLMMCV